MQRLIEDIQRRYNNHFMTIAIGGSVAVGKSTFAKLLAQHLAVDVAIISTDDFLMSNDSLIAQGLFNQKGFPETYDLQALSSVITRFSDGEQAINIPKYEQELADIHPKKQQLIHRPDILIIEGVVALQVDNVDYRIYLDADLANIKSWYLARTLEMTALSRNDPDSWRYQYAKMPIGELADYVMAIWDQTNQVNLNRFILPTRDNADTIVTLDKYHDVQNITIN